MKRKSKKEARPWRLGACPVEVVTEATLELLRSLDELVFAHREDPIPCTGFDGVPQEGPLVTGSLPVPDFARAIGEQLDALPLREVWEDWCAQRPSEQRDDDGCEVLRAYMLLDAGDERLELEDWLEEDASRASFARVLLGAEMPPFMRFESTGASILRWLVPMERNVGHFDFALDVIEAAIAALPEDALEGTKPYEEDWESEDMHRDFRRLELFELWLMQAANVFARSDPALSVEQRNRFKSLLRLIEEPVSGATSYFANKPRLVNVFRLV